MSPKWTTVLDSSTDGVYKNFADFRENRALGIKAYKHTGTGRTGRIPMLQLSSQSSTREPEHTWITIVLLLFLLKEHDTWTRTHFDWNFAAFVCICWYSKSLSYWFFTIDRLIQIIYLFAYFLAEDIWAIDRFSLLVVVGLCQMEWTAMAFLVWSETLEVNSVNNLLCGSWQELSKGPIHGIFRLLINWKSVSFISLH